MRSTWIIIGLLASLAACNQPGNETTNGAVPEHAAEHSAEAPIDPPIGGLPQAVPPAAAPPRFVGLWAVNQSLCGEPAWRFEADEVSTRGEVHCGFDRVLPVPTGYSIAATCTAEAPPAPYQMEFAISESGDAMTIAGGPWAHANLVRCGPLAGD